MTPARRGVALTVVIALLASLVVVATATASPRGGSTTSTSDPMATASVVGGHNATIAQYPSLAYIEGLQATSGYACTGTVVAPRVILTAGHCVEDIESSSIVQPEEIAVATGVSNHRDVSEANVNEVKQALVYPHFSPTRLHGDAGLLILKQPVSAPPIALATKADTALYEPGNKLTIAGWGVDDQITGHAPNQLQAATVPIEEPSGCKRRTRRFDLFYDPSFQFCTLDAPHFKVIFCHGDSGGPAIAVGEDGTPVEIGVISLNDGICNPKEPAVYTRADRISHWVQSWIDAVENGGPEPEIVVPRSHIPFLTTERAEELSFIVLEEELGSRFLNAQEPSIRCSHLAKARAKCVLTWFQGPNDYFGTTTAFFGIRKNVVLAGLHFTINWVNDHCYFHSGHPQTCRIHTKRG